MISAMSATPGSLVVPVIKVSLVMINAAPSSAGRLEFLSINSCVGSESRNHNEPAKSSAR